MAVVIFVIFLIGVAGIALLKSPLFILVLLLGIVLSIGFTVVNPNKAVVMTLFGAYSGTINANGFFLGESLFL